MTNRVLIVVGLFAVLASGSVVAIAQPPQGGPGMHGPGRGPRGGFGSPRADLGLRGIDLTDAQRDQLRGIMQSHQSEFEAVRTKLRAAHRALAEATQGETVDEATIRARSAEVGTAMADEAVLRTKVRAEVFAILTPEQQQKAKELRDTVRQRMQERLQKRQQLRQERRQQ